MNSDAVWNMTEKSRLKREDEVRMQELRHLFDLMDEREEEWQVTKKALKILSWCVEQHCKWLKAFHSDAKTMLCMMKPTLDIHK